MTWILSVLIISANAQVPQDKQVHFLASYSLNATLVHAMPKHKIWAAGLTLGAGLAKECADEHFDNGDMLADILGVVTSSLFTWSF